MPTPNPRDLDPKFKTVPAPEEATTEPETETPAEPETETPTEESKDAKNIAPVPGSAVPGGAVTPLDATIDPDDETYIVYKHPDGDVRMKSSEWPAYAKENGL